LAIGSSLLRAQPVTDEDPGPMPRDHIRVEEGAVILPPRGAAVFVAPPEV
jgi:hypothetical protein